MVKQKGQIKLSSQQFTRSSILTTLIGTLYSLHLNLLTTILLNVQLRKHPSFSILDNTLFIQPQSFQVLFKLLLIQLFQTFYKLSLIHCKRQKQTLRKLKNNSPLLQTGIVVYRLSISMIKFSCPLKILPLQVQLQSRSSHLASLDHF